MFNKEVAGGLAMLVFAGAYALAASNLSMTSSLGIGAGLFPMALAGVLAILGIIVAIQGFRATRGAPDAATDLEPETRVPYRALLLITAAPVAFALLVVPLGVVPALGLAVFLSALSSRETTPLGALAVSAVMVVFCVGLFKWGLGLPIELFGPAFSFLQ